MSVTENETPDEQEIPLEQPDAPQTPQEPAEAPDTSPEPEAPENGDEVSAEPDVPQQAGLTPEQWEKRFKTAEQRFATYERNIYSIFEEDAHDLIPCPLCLGAVRGFVDKNAAGRVPEEQADLVKHFLGIARPIDYPHSSQHRTCPECEGLGKVTTGSRVPGKETIGCGACHELGYIGPAPSRTNGQVDVPSAVTGPTVFSEQLPADDRDEWDQPRLLPDGRENPNFGRTPKYWINVEPWGDTRGLTAQDKVA